MVEQAGTSDTESILRNAAWMTSSVDKAENLLSKVGISISRGNKLELDEEAFRKADMTTIKSIFSGNNSFSSVVDKKVGDKDKDSDFISKYIAQKEEIDA